MFSLFWGSERYTRGYGCDMLWYVVIWFDAFSILLTLVAYVFCSWTLVQRHDYTDLTFGSKASKDQAGFWEDITMFKDRIPKSLLEVFIRCSSKAPTMRTRQLLWTMAKPQGQRRKIRWKEADGFANEILQEEWEEPMQLLYCVLCPFGCRRVQHIHCGINIHQWHWMHHVNGSVFEADGKPRKIHSLLDTATTQAKKHRWWRHFDILTTWRAQLEGCSMSLDMFARDDEQRGVWSSIPQGPMPRSAMNSADWWSWSTCEATSRHPRLSLFPKWGKSWSTIRINISDGQETGDLVVVNPSGSIFKPTWGLWPWSSICWKKMACEAFPNSVDLNENRVFSSQITML